MALKSDVVSMSHSCFYALIVELDCVSSRRGFILYSHAGHLYKPEAAEKLASV